MICEIIYFSGILSIFKDQSQIFEPSSFFGKLQIEMKRLLFLLCVTAAFIELKAQSIDNFNNCFEITYGVARGGCRDFTIKVIREGIFVSMPKESDLRLDSTYWKPYNTFTPEEYVLLYNEIEKLFYLIDSMEEYKQGIHTSHFNAYELSILNLEENIYKSKIISPCGKEIRSFLKLIVKILDEPKFNYLSKKSVHCR